MGNWYSESSPLERRTFWASFGGWALDALDVQMFSLAIPALIAAFHITKAEAGLLGSITLFFGAIGGWFGGALGDRFGRVKALQMTIATFALATFASAFAMSYSQLVVLKAIQGLGFGAEWACGAVLMAEIIRPEHRGTALGAVQSAWAVGVKYIPSRRHGTAVGVCGHRSHHLHERSGHVTGDWSIRRCSTDTVDCISCHILRLAHLARQLRARYRDQLTTADGVRYNNVSRFDGH